MRKQYKYELNSFYSLLWKSKEHPRKTAPLILPINDTVIFRNRTLDDHFYSNVINEVSKKPKKNLNFNVLDGDFINENNTTP
jgi:chemotaxis methyl-accepting protein methylase